MMEWLQNPQAGYVLAAYGLALVALAGLGVWAWCGWRAQTKRAVQHTVREHH